MSAWPLRMLVSRADMQIIVWLDGAWTPNHLSTRLRSVSRSRAREIAPGVHGYVHCDGIPSAAPPFRILRMPHQQVPAVGGGRSPHPSLLCDCPSQGAPFCWRAPSAHRMRRRSLALRPRMDEMCEAPAQGTTTNPTRGRSRQAVRPDATDTRNIQLGGQGA